MTGGVIQRREDVKPLGSFAETHCVFIDKRPMCHRFQVEDAVVCAFLYGLDGRTFEVRRLKFEGCDPEFAMPYPACAPMILMDEGEERIFSKPGWYEICACDGEPLPKNFCVDTQALSECQAKVAMMEAHLRYLCERDIEQAVQQAKAN